MRLFARRTLREFASRLAGRPDHEAVSAALDHWHDEVQKAQWRSSAELKATFRTASIINAERVVFNIKGNDYRLVAAVDYLSQIVWIKWIGTHRDYDKIDVASVKYER